MAAPAYNTDLSDITLAESVTNWSALGGGAAGLGVGADFSMQGNLCVDKQITSAEKGQIYNNGATITPATNTHFYVWIFLATAGLANTLQNRGLAVIAGTSTTAYVAFHVEGNDTYGAAGRVGKCYPIRYNNTTSASPPYRTLTGSAGANPQYFGATANITAAVKGANLGVDAIRYGTGVFITAGELANPALFSGLSSTNDSISNRWGVFSKIGGGYELQGKLVIGQNTSGTPTAAYFSDSNAVISIVDTPHSLSNFSQIIIDHASTEVYLTNVTIQALGTNNSGQFIINNASSIVELEGCSFLDTDITTLRAATVSNNCTWRGSGQITANGAQITNGTIADYSGSTGTSALIWNTATDTDGLLDETEFTKGSGTTHALELGLSSPTTVTLTNVIFSGYNASDGQTDSAIHVKRTSGTVTINIDGGTTPSYISDGATVNIVSGVVPIEVEVVNSSGSPIENARILIETSNGTGPFPYRESVSITRSGSLATVSHTGHGMSTNDKVVIRGANEQEYNGVFTITVTGTNSYTYTISGSPATTATGTIISSFVALEGLTNASGLISTTRSYPSNQPIIGKARKSSSSPYYRTSGITGTVDIGSGFSVVIQMIEDE